MTHDPKPANVPAHHTRGLEKLRFSLALQKEVYFLSSGRHMHFLRSSPSSIFSFLSPFQDYSPSFILFLLFFCLCFLDENTTISATKQVKAGKHAQSKSQTLCMHFHVTELVHLSQGILITIPFACDCKNQNLKLNCSWIIFLIQFLSFYQKRKPKPEKLRFLKITEHSQFCSLDQYDCFCGTMQYCAVFATIALESNLKSGLLYFLICSCFSELLWLF